VESEAEVGDEVGGVRETKEVISHAISLVNELVVVDLFVRTSCSSRRASLSAAAQLGCKMA
jgi:hypothetical protein